MPERSVYHPRPAATALGMAIPLLALGALGTGVAMLATGGTQGLLFGAVFLIIGVLVGIFAIVLFRHWFSMKVDSSGLALVGVFGSRGFVLNWEDLAAIGMCEWQGAHVLGARPRKAWESRPTRFVLHWDRDGSLLLIAGVERWSRPADEILKTLRAHAGEKWTESLEPVPAERDS